MSPRTAVSVQSTDREADFVTLYVYLHPVGRADAPLHVLEGSHSLGASVFPHDLTRMGEETFAYRNGEHGEAEVRLTLLTGETGQAAPIAFRLDPASGVPTYLQLVRQVEHALLLGYLRAGDQLPKIRDVVAELAINPNTVLKAYRELERDGLVSARPGIGTFVTRSLADASLAAHEPLRRDLERWLGRARAAGVDDESIEALFRSAFRGEQRGVA